MAIKKERPRGFEQLAVNVDQFDEPRLLVDALLSGTVPIQGSSTGTPIPVVGCGISMSQSFTRPHDTTPYAAGDIVSNSAAGTSPMIFHDFARVLGGTGYIVKVRLETNVKAKTPRFRVHFFKDVVGLTLSADNALHEELYADRAKRIGYIDLPAMTSATHASSDVSRADVETCRKFFSTLITQRDLYAVLETLDIWTPANDQQFTLTIGGDLN